MSENYFFVSGADLMLPVTSIYEEPDEETIMAAQVANIDIACDDQMEQHQQESSCSAPVTTNTADEIKMDTEEQIETKEEKEIVEEKKTEKPENAEVAEEEKEEEFIEEDTYVAFGPGGDPGRDKALGELMDEDEGMPHKPWIRDDCYDSEDSYFDEDFFDDFDDCF